MLKKNFFEHKRMQMSFSNIHMGYSSIFIHQQVICIPYAICLRSLEMKRESIVS